jgi:asparagine synthase (glutamine-hydrolysing)
METCMPGLVGLISKMPRELAQKQLCGMMKTLCHEPFYVSGAWADGSLGVYAGWVARRGSFAEPMPLHSERGEVTLIFSGEEFPHPGIIPALKERGHSIEPNSASYLVHRYEDEPDFPKRLNGRFHGLVADRTRGTVLLFNDRYGLQRLYYHEAKDAVYFASEAKAILQVCQELRTIDAKGLAEFVTCGCVLENRSLFSGIHVLPPGAAWTFRKGVLESKGSYFNPQEWEQQEPLEPEEYYRELRSVFVQNLPRYFSGEERAGVSLTGGLDTRIIMAWHKAEPNSLPCYTFGSMYRDNEDVKLAQCVAKICRQPHQVIVTGDQFLSQFAHYAERSVYLNDACVDLSRSPDLYVNEKVREIAPVRIVGTFGSEIMARAVMFKAEDPVVGLFQPEVSRQIVEAKTSYHSARRGHPVTFVAFRQSPWHHYGLLTLEQTQVSIRSPYLDNDFVKTVYKAPDSVAINEQSRLRLVREGNPLLARLRTDRGVGGLYNGFARACLEFLFKAEYAYDIGMPQWVAQIDHLFGWLQLERIWLGRHKIFHFRVWYRDQLAKYVREILLDPRSLARPYVEPKAVRAVVDAHIKGNRNYTTEIHRLLTLELAHRLFVDSN